MQLIVRVVKSDNLGGVSFSAVSRDPNAAAWSIPTTSKLLKRMAGKQDQLFHATVSEEQGIRLGDFAPWNSWEVVPA